MAPTTLVGRVRATGRVCRPGERAGRVPLAYAGRARLRAAAGVYPWASATICAGGMILEASTTLCAGGDFDFELCVSLRVAASPGRVLAGVYAPGLSPCVCAVACLFAFFW